MKTLYAFLIISVSSLLCACGGADSFQVMVTVEGLGTQNVRAVYNDGVRTNIVPAMAIDGKFQFICSSDVPVAIDLYTRSLARIGSVVAVNGDNVEASFTMNEPGTMNIKGNDISEQLSEFYRKNATIINEGNGEVINKAIADFVGRNSGNPVSLFLILSLFDTSVHPELADSLLTVIDYDRRNLGEMVAGYKALLDIHPDSVNRFLPISLYTIGDSMTTIRPIDGKGVLLAITDAVGFGTPDSLIARFNNIQSRLKGVARVTHFTVANDSVAWANAGHDVKPKFTRCWDPMGVAIPEFACLSINRVPWYVSADSTGVIIYRGDNEEMAIAAFE
ncbi:MAG: hypothetical protein NC082_09390 [Clostridiales bacterium]|nr:hypothetical protein [Clostridiales bacterium]